MESLAPATNTLGLPLIKQAIAEVLFHVIADDDEPDQRQPAEQKKAREEMSLLGVLNTYNRDNYKLSPVVVQEVLLFLTCSFLPGRLQCLLWRYQQRSVVAGLAQPA